MFSEAEKYERFMGRWSQRLAPLFVGFADVKNGERVLDVGCGTGSLALAMAGHGVSEVVAIDLSLAYVEFATVRERDSRIRFQVGDAQKLAFSSATFDRCVSLLALNFIPDARMALSEMRRVARPGGWIAACVWDYGEGMEMLRKFWDAVVSVDPAAAQRDERNMRLSRQGELSALWREAGLDDIKEQGLVVDTPFRSFSDYWEPFLDGQGPAGAYVENLGQPERNKLESRLRSTILDGKSDGPFTLRARAWAARGQVGN
jgi:ubiquinone/menaquinone biosynthesis C-methylase UbiE